MLIGSFFVVLSLIVALIASALVGEASTVAYHMFMYLILPGAFLLLTLAAVPPLVGGCLHAWNFRRAKKKINARLPNLNQFAKQQLAGRILCSKNANQIIEAYGVVRNILTNASNHDVITVAKEIAEGRNINQYSWQKDVVGRLDGESLNYLIDGSWKHSKERNEKIDLYEKERQYLEDNFPNIDFPKHHLEKLCSLIYFNWKVVSIEQHELEIHVSMSRREEKMSLSFCTNVDIYLANKLSVENEYPALKEYKDILSRLSRLTYYGWIVREVNRVENELTVSVIRGQKNMMLKFNEPNK